MESLGRLTGGVAHDFNNLLTVVIGNLGMARTRLEGGAQERALRSIEAAAEGARRAATLTQRLLAFSRQQPLAPVAIEVNQRVLAMSELLRRTLGEDVALETVLAGGLWRAEADPNQLESALLNLAVNARDAMPDGGRLTLETANAWLGEDYAAGREEVQPGQYVMVSVSDTGQGMPPEVAARAFEPFFTTKPPGKGTGLGLSQVYGFAKQSGGHVAIYSEPGHGTTVKLYLPRQRTAQPAAPAEAPAEAPAATGRGEVVLVLEDEEMVRDFAVAVLEEAGFRPLPAAEGESALALLRDTPDVRLLFTDVVLSGAMNGRRVADLAREMRPGLPVLFTTGYTRNAIIHHGRLDEGVNLLGKPYTAAALVQRVRALLDAAAAPGGAAG
jgi:CheY-like chemotaxis protein